MNWKGSRVVGDGPLRGLKHGEEGDRSLCLSVSNGYREEMMN